MIGGVKRIYLDHAATSYPKPESVYTAMDRYAREVGVAAGRGSHARAVEAARTLDSARSLAARLFGIADSRRIAFTANATDALHLALNGVLCHGDRVVTTVMEHNSVLRPLRALEDRGEVEVLRVRADGDGRVDLDALEAACDAGLRLLVIQHASNVTGALQPVREAAQFAHRRGGIVLVDAAQTAGASPIDVTELGIDALACAGHKGLLGPLGTGLLYVRDGIDIDPVRCGGTGTHSEDDHQPKEWPDRFESGSLNLVGIAGLEAGLAHVQQRGVAAIQSHKRALTQRFLYGVAEIPRLRVLGPSDANMREPVFPFLFPELEPHELAMVLDIEFGIEVRAGLHCAPFAHRAIGTGPAGAVRASFGESTSVADVDALIDALRAIAAKLG